MHNPSNIIKFIVRNLLFMYLKYLGTNGWLMPGSHSKIENKTHTDGTI